MLRSVVKGLCLSAVVATFVGCDSNSTDKIDIPSSSGETLSTPVTISGTAAKGLVAGGVVNAYSIVNGLRSSVVTSSTVTNASGEYDVVFEAGSPDTPYIFEIVVGENTTMKCDIPGGCDGGAQFGEVFDITDSSFMLSTFVADATVEDSNGNVVATQTANANVFTHITTQSIVEELAVGQSTSSIQATIQSVQSSVTSRFGLTGDVTQLPVIDITDAAAVNNANEETLRFSAINSAIIAATIESGAGSVTITDAIATFTTQFTSTGLADIESESTTSVSFVEVLNNASTVISSVSSITGVTSSVVSTVVTAINDSVTITTQIGSTIPTKGTPSPTAGDTDIAQAKAFMQDLRHLSEDSFFAESDEMDFDSLARNAEMVEQIDADNIVDAVELMLDGALAANRAYSDLDGELTLVNMPFMTEIDGLMYSVTATAGANDSQVFTVAQSDVMLNMVATVVELSDETQESTDAEASFSESFEAIANMMLSGDVTVGQSKVSVQALSISASGEGSETTVGMNTAFEEQLALNLSGAFTIEQLDEAGVAELTLSGDAVFTLDNVAYSERDEDSLSAESSSDLSSQTLSFDGVSLSLSGDIADASGANFDVALALTLGEFSASRECLSSNDCPDVESADNFVPVTLSLAFEGLIANASVVSVVATLTRVAQEEVGLSIALTYDGKRVMVSSQTDRDGLTIMNQDSIVADLDESEEGLAQGTIKKGEKLLANIVTTSNDLVLVRYIDGTVESL